MENRREMLAKAPLLPLLIKLSVPAMLGMFVMASYNVVDAIFIGWGVGPLGIAATSVAFPMQLFVGALSMWIAMGTASLSSRRLGAGLDDDAERALANGFLMSSVLGFVTMTLGLTFVDQLIGLMGTGEPVAGYAKEYLRIVFLGNPLIIVGMLFNNTIRSEGNTRYAMYSMVLPAVLNVFLDPLFIFGFKMGMAGAAWATVTGQLVTFLWVLRYYLTGRRSLIELKFSKMPLRWEIDREILSVGASEFARQGALTVANSILMNQISRYGTPQHIAAFSIMMKVSSLAVMPIFGLGQGMQPIVGYCWGAGLYARARKTIELALGAALAITATAEVFLLTFPHVFVRAFTNDPEVVRLTVWGVRILQSTFAIVGFQVIGTVVFQALGFAGPALFLSMSRQVIFFIPALVFLPRFWGVTGVFASYPVADVAACCVTLGFLLVYRKRFRRLEEKQ
ncbi:MAG: MATE family efflux transporter [Pyramidobacter sp.]|nr:MATE family efflux transporter [Pyramidobacter sp.]MBR0108945.1 MATE family efflux transporter [Pyramidobacter sp.]